MVAQPSLVMQGLLCDGQVEAKGDDVAMIDVPAALGDCGVLMVVGEGRSADVMGGEADMRGQVASVTCAKLVMVLEDDSIKDDLGEAVWCKTGVDVGWPSVSMTGVNDELAISTGPVEVAVVVGTGSVDDEAGTIVVGEGGVKVANGSGSEAAGRVKSRVDVGQLDPSKMVAEGVSVDEPSWVMGGEAVSKESGSGRASSCNVGAVVIAAGSRADVDRPGSDDPRPHED